MARLKRALALGLAWVASELGCAHAEAGAPGPEAPAAAPAAPAANNEAPKTTLLVASKPIDALRSAYFTALELTFENPSSEWHEVRRVSIGPERQMFGPALETLMGARLRAWQLAARQAHKGDAPPHIALDTLASDAALGDPSKAAEPKASDTGAPPDHLLAGAFLVAPGMFTRKWVVLYCSAKDGLLGQDLMLSYELEKGQVERVLLQYPKPAPEK